MITEEELKVLIAEFLAKGGVIQKIPCGKKSAVVETVYQKNKKKTSK